MKMNLESIRWYLKRYGRLLELAEGLCEGLGVDFKSADVGKENLRSSLAKLDELLAAGITELEVPER